MKLYFLDHKRYYFTEEFMILVLRTSTGEPMTAATNPATEEQNRWHPMVSSISFARRTISFTWSNLFSERVDI